MQRNDNQEICVSATWLSFFLKNKHFLVHVQLRHGAMCDTQKIATRLEYKVKNWPKFLDDFSFLFA